jgi:predicted  nucleic acid-binding Zn-ribbon protein
MLTVIEKLLVLQDRDRRIQRLELELANLGPERQALQSKGKESQAALDSAKLRVKQIESDRKKIELDVEAKKQQIEKYSLQQFQTKKNEEYKALAHEIENCKVVIGKLEDQQLEVMESADGAAKELALASQIATDVQKRTDGSMQAIADREKSLSKQLADLKSDYSKLREAVEEGALARYERIRKQKGGSAVVGIDHSVCGGCHMKLPVQIIVSCQGQHEIVTCPNSGRILYFTKDMDLAIKD